MVPVPDVSNLDVVFGGNAMKILPPYKDIPEEFKNNRNKWCQMVSDWFFFGIKDVTWTPKPGVNTARAVAALKCCMSSWEPQHEHKEAGVAFLLSEWFEDVTYKRAKKKPG